MRRVLGLVVAITTIVLSDTDERSELLESEDLVDAPVAAALVDGEDADYGESLSLSFALLYSLLF